MGRSSYLPEYRTLRLQQTLQFPVNKLPEEIRGRLGDPRLTAEARKLTFRCTDLNELAFQAQQTMVFLDRHLR